MLSVGPSHTLREVATRMTEFKVGSAVVLTDAGPAIITERDILRGVADGVDLDATTVDDYMTSEAITASTSWDVKTAANEMSTRGFRHLVVVDDDGKVVGVLSIRDLVQSLLDG
ncbi:MAG: CBS domain-containing protein [Actinomycetota bacterium]